MVPRGARLDGQVDGEGIEVGGIDIQIRRTSFDCFVFLRKQESRVIGYFAALGSCFRRSTTDCERHRFRQEHRTTVLG
jgi:hypothetical protein